MSTCSTAPFNYACNLGIHSVAAAVIFAVLYVPLFLWHTGQAIVRPTYVFIVLSLFCQIRIAAFVTRAVLAASEQAGESRSLYLASTIIFSAGFFGLLYSTYTLVLDRDLILSPPRTDRPVMRLTRNRSLFRIALTAAVVLGIVGASYSFGSKASSRQLSHTLRKASVIIFLVLVILLALQIIRVARYETTESDPPNTESLKSFGGRQGTHILMVISGLLLIREVFFVVTVNKTNSESLWYVLAVLPEFLAVCLLAIPGLVPPRSDLPK